MMNPASLMKMKAAGDRFAANHPKLISFFKVVFGSGMPEGTVVEITVTKPGQEPITTNMRVQQSDLDLFEEMKGLM